MRLFHAMTKASVAVARRVREATGTGSGPRSASGLSVACEPGAREAQGSSSPKAGDDMLMSVSCARNGRPVACSVVGFSVAAGSEHREHGVEVGQVDLAVGVGVAVGRGLSEVGEDEVEVGEVHFVVTRDIGGADGFV